MNNRQGRIILCILFSLHFFFFLDAQKIDKSDWSGTITYLNIEKSSSSYSEQRYEGNFTNGKGHVKSNWTLKLNGSDEKREGKAEGSAASEIAIWMWDMDSGLYKIEFPTSEVFGSITITSKEGSRTIPWRENDGGSLISTDWQKLGKNPNVLAGTYKDTYPAKDGGEESVTTITWSFTRGPIDVDLIVTPINYNNWLPIPGADEKSPGSQITIGLQVKGKNGKPLPFGAKYFELELKNTSSEKGITINYPANNSSNETPLPDLRFLPEDGANMDSSGQTIKVKCDDGKTGSAQIASYDGGGYTTLSVEAVLEGGIRVKGHLEKPEGPTDILIPKRKEGSKIATSWLNENGNPGEDDDKDSSPGNNNAGDGLTAYEEYRGVWTQGKFKRLSAKKKELGVGVEKKNMDQFAAGIALLKAAAGIDIIVLNEDELNNKKIFNINSQAGGHMQYALKLYNKNANGAEGVNVPKERHNKTPKLSDSVIIDIDQIKASYHKQDSVAQKTNTKLPYTAEDDIESTVAHEMAHGIHVAHHGPPSDEPSHYTASIESSVVFKIYDVDGNLITKRPYEITGNVGSVGCDASGDLKCIMAYTNNYQWAYKKGEDGSLIYHAVPPLPQGKHLCTSSKGTGINANGYFGDATEGNCLSQIKIRDE